MAPLGGADGQMVSGGGDPWGEGKGEGGAAAFMLLILAVESCGSGVLRAFFLGGAVDPTPEVDSTPSIRLSSVRERFLPNRSTASARSTTLLLSLVSSRLSNLHPFPPTTSCSSCISVPTPSPSWKVARWPPGNTRGKLRRLGGRLA